MGVGTPRRLSGASWPLRGEHAHAHASAVGMAVHPLHTLAQHVLADEGVGVEEEHVAALALPYGEVVAAGKAQIFLAGDDVGLGKLLADEVGRPVARVVVYHPHIGLQTLEGPVYTAKALPEVVPYVIAYDDDG